MKKMYTISIITFIYALILALVTFLFFREYLLWTVLGSAVALFNNSLATQSLKGKFTTQKVVTNLVTRYILYTVIVAIVYFDTKDLGTTTMIYSYVFLLLGIFSLKIGIFIYHTPLIKKEAEGEVMKDGTDSNDAS
ncbi:MAG: hypothetical protein V3569_02150 [Acholeplasmataceae bacterium]|nr:hypothetical protein [Acholeplasmataceae bacterium]